MDRLRDERVVLEGVAAHPDEVLRARVVGVVLEAVAVHEVRVRHANLLRLRVHALDEGRLRAGDVDGHVVGRVVRRVDEHGVQQLAEGRGIGLHVAGGLRLAAEVGVGDRADVVQGLAGVERDDRRHDLRDGGHRELLVRVLGEEHVARLVHHDGGLRLGERGCLLAVCGQGARGREDANEDGERRDKAGGEGGAGRRRPLGARGQARRRGEPHASAPVPRGRRA